jgi:hypothetical protein
MERPPVRAAFLRKPAAFAAAPSPDLGADLHECRDPGHGSGRPRLVFRHRITSFLVVEPKVVMYGDSRPPTSDVRGGGESRCSSRAAADAAIARVA